MTLDIKVVLKKGDGETWQTREDNMQQRLWVKVKATTLWPHGVYFWPMELMHWNMHMHLNRGSILFILRFMQLVHIWGNQMIWLDCFYCIFSWKKILLPHNCCWCFNAYLNVYVGIYRFHCTRCCTLYSMLAELGSQEN